MCQYKEKIINRSTPGIPKKPAIRQVIILIPILKPRVLPNRFTNKSKIKPNTPFTISFHSNLRGHVKSLKKKNMQIMLIKITIEISKGSPLYTIYFTICKIELYYNLIT